MLLAKEDEMRSMIVRLENYLEKKGLELNVEKTKMMRFRKGGVRIEKRDWKWKGKKLEEVKEYKYLGYTLQRNGGQEAHIKERIKKSSSGRGVGNDRKENVWRELEQKDMAFRQVDMDGIKLWGRDMGMEEEGKTGESRGKVLKVDIWIG